MTRRTTKDILVVCGQQRTEALSELKWTKTLSGELTMFTMLVHLLLHMKKTRFSLFKTGHILYILHVWFIQQKYASVVSGFQLLI